MGEGEQARQRDDQQAEHDGRTRRQRRRRDDDRHQQQDREGIVEPAGQVEQPAELEDVVGEQQQRRAASRAARLAG